MERIGGPSAGMQGRAAPANAERDRILQRLFAVGLSLHAVAPEAGGAVADRINRTVEELDVIIAELRESIATAGDA